MISKPYIEPIDSVSIGSQEMSAMKHWYVINGHKSVAPSWMQESNFSQGESTKHPTPKS